MKKDLAEFVIIILIFGFGLIMAKIRHPIFLIGMIVGYMVLN